MFNSEVIVAVSSILFWILFFRIIFLKKINPYLVNRCRSISDNLNSLESEFNELKNELDSVIKKKKNIWIDLLEIDRNYKAKELFFLKEFYKKERSVVLDIEKIKYLNIQKIKKKNYNNLREYIFCDFGDKLKNRLEGENAVVSDMEYEYIKSKF